MPDGCDNCPAIANIGQENADGDSSGDVCDTCTDTDGDGFGDPGFPANTCAEDTCQDFDDNLDADGDTVPDGCDVCPGFDDTQDGDLDGVPDGCDLCLGDDATGDVDGDGLCASVDCDDMDSDVGLPDRCGVCGGDGTSCLIFEDGFESGDTSGWSTTVNWPGSHRSAL